MFDSLCWLLLCELLLFVKFISLCAKKANRQTPTTTPQKANTPSNVPENAASAFKTETQTTVTKNEDSMTTKKPHDKKTAADGKATKPGAAAGDLNSPNKMSHGVFSEDAGAKSKMNTDVKTENHSKQITDGDKSTGKLHKKKAGSRRSAKVSPYKTADGKARVPNKDGYDDLKPDRSMVGTEDNRSLIKKEDGGYDNLDPNEDEPPKPLKTPADELLVEPDRSRSQQNKQAPPQDSNKKPAKKSSPPKSNKVQVPQKPSKGSTQSKASKTGSMTSTKLAVTTKKSNDKLDFKTARAKSGAPGKKRSYDDLKLDATQEQ